VIYDGSVMDFKPTIEGSSYSLLRTLISAVLVTLVASTAIATFEVLYFNKLLKKKPLGFTLLFKTAFYLFNIFFVSSFGVILIISFDADKSLFSNEVLNLFSGYILSTRFIMTMLYWGFAVMIALFILQVSDKFGQGVLISFLLGKYHQPKEEVRIFMFMDLKSSTTYAEKLGHIKYSQMIQDCFFDLTEIVLKHRAQIYQYVGDEVILTWEIKKGLSKNNCLDVFYDYDQLLKNKSDYYKGKYETVPEFKAGLNVGYITAAEVGELKKELAYHGDTINTAARIQDRCNEFQSRLLVPEDLKNQLPDQNKYNFEMIGNITLKGKEKTVNILKVTPSAV
jgi:adenylate cyclase